MAVRCLLPCDRPTEWQCGGRSSFSYRGASTRLRYLVGVDTRCLSVEEKACPETAILARFYVAFAHRWGQRCHWPRLGFFVVTGLCWGTPLRQYPPPPPRTPTTHPHPPARACLTRRAGCTSIVCLQQGVRCNARDAMREMRSASFNFTKEH